MSRSGQGRGPRRLRLRRPARIESARAWIASGARVTIRTYAKRYGVDRYTAHTELTTLGMAFAAGDAQWATRPPPIPKSRPEPASSPTAKRGLPEGWVWYGTDLMFPVGCTEGGAPYGLMAWELDDAEGAETFGEYWEELRRMFEEREYRRPSAYRERDSPTPEAMTTEGIGRSAASKTPPPLGCTTIHRHIGDPTADSQADGSIMLRGTLASAAIARGSTSTAGSVVDVLAAGKSSSPVPPAQNRCR